MAKTKTLGEIVVAIREKAGINRNALAVQAGINAAYLMRLERGQVDHPSFETMRKLADVLDVSLDVFRVNGPIRK